MDNDLKFLMDEIRSDQKPVKPKRRKKRRRGGRLLLVFLLVFLLVSMGGGLAFWWMNRPERKLPGHWHRTVDYTAECTMHAKEWLLAAEGGEAVDLKDYMGSISVDIDLILSGDGTWSCSVDEQSYRTASGEAAQALEYALEDLLIRRVQAAGREMSTREEAAQSIRDAIGIDCREYLSVYGPALLPALEELQQQYAGSGEWKAENGVLLRGGSGEAFLINTDLLVLSGAGGTEVYYRNAD